MKPALQAHFLFGANPLCRFFLPGASPDFLYTWHQHAGNQRYFVVSIRGIQSYPAPPSLPACSSVLACFRGDPCSRDDPCSSGNPCSRHDLCSSGNPCSRDDPCSSGDPCFTCSFRFPFSSSVSDELKKRTLEHKLNFSFRKTREICLPRSLLDEGPWVQSSKHGDTSDWLPCRPAQSSTTQSFSGFFF